MDEFNSDLSQRKFLKDSTVSLDAILLKGSVKSEGHLNNLFQKPRLTRRFSEAFNEAVKSTFLDELRDIFSRCCKNSCWAFAPGKKGCFHSYLLDDDGKNMVSIEELQRKIQEIIEIDEKTILQELIISKLKEIQILKQRLQFSISQISYKKSEFEILIERNKLLMKNLEKIRELSHKIKSLIQTNNFM